MCYKTTSIGFKLTNKEESTMRRNGLNENQLGQFVEFLKNQNQNKEESKVVPLTFIDLGSSQKAVEEILKKEVEGVKIDWPNVKESVKKELPKRLLKYEVIHQGTLIITGYSAKSNQDLANFLLSIKGKDFQVLNRRQECIAILGPEVTTNCSFYIY